MEWQREKVLIMCTVYEGIKQNALGIHTMRVHIFDTVSILGQYVPIVWPQKELPCYRTYKSLL